MLQPVSTGRTGAEIRKERPDWQLFRDGCPGGESPKQVDTRAHRVVARAREVQGDVLIFTSGHFMRVLASRWLGLRTYTNQQVLHAEYGKPECSGL
jgi:probable phosphoglycerate mutase